MGRPDVRCSILSSSVFLRIRHLLSVSTFTSFSQSSLYWTPDPELLLLHFLFLPSCLQISVIGRTVPCPPVFHLSYAGNVHASFSFPFLLYALSYCVLICVVSRLKLLLKFITVWSSVELVWRWYILAICYQWIFFTFCVFHQFHNFCILLSLLLLLLLLLCW
jgi:hypothetical protein